MKTGNIHELKPSAGDMLIEDKFGEQRVFLYVGIHMEWYGEIWFAGILIGRKAAGEQLKYQSSQKPILRAMNPKKYYIDVSTWPKLKALLHISSIAKKRICNALFLNFG